MISEVKMRKNIVIVGFILLALGVVLGFLSGAVLPGNITIPLLYGSNQIFWLFIAGLGLVIGVVGLFLRAKKI